MDKEIDVSVIVVSYNTKNYTLSCVKSVFRSKTKKKIEVIVVDNASCDGTCQSLQKFGSKLKLIKNNKNLGFAKANNQGIKIAKGKYLFLLNSDAEIGDYVIDRLIDFADFHPNVGVVVPRLLNSDGSVQKSVFKLPTLSGAILEYWLNMKGNYGQYSPKGKAPVEIESAVMAAFLITPIARKYAPFLNEKYFMYFEDLDYCRKIRNFGLSIYYLPYVKVVHHLGKSGYGYNQWRRLVPSSKIYHGALKHYLIWFVMKTNQLVKKIYNV
ncbi:MAG: glycosyltransferase family 2 protein [Patescibacteria group bacterium]|nr:glycosyltransferase family 2 protein [Patescibacteria group bacterium]